MEQTCGLETVKPQEISIKVCVIFYNRYLLSRLWRKNKFYCNQLIQNQPPEVFFIERCSQKFSKIHRKTPALESSFVSCRPDACNFIKKETLTQVFSCKFCDFSKNTFLTEHLQKAAFVNIPKEMYSCRLINRGGGV